MVWKPGERRYGNPVSCGAWEACLSFGQEVHVVSYQQSVRPLSWLFSVLEILSLVASVRAVHVAPTAFGKAVRVVVLLGGDPVL